MIWAKYEAQFRAAAAQQNHSDAYVSSCLSYASTLFKRNAPVIFNMEHFSGLVGYREEYLLGCCYDTRKFYRTFTIPKSSGGTRTISEPLPSLKEVQRWILDSILSGQAVSKFAKGFVRRRSIKENARFHKRQPIVLSLDIKDFFPTISRPRVYGVFRGIGYTKELSTYFARLCTIDDVLPQGAPTSPYLSNIVTRGVDRRLGGLAKRFGLRFTRYADDITFSGNVFPGALIPLTRSILEQEGFSLNETKTRSMARHQRQEVTGVVVNDRLRAPSNLRRELRQAVHYVSRYGLSGHLEKTGETRANYTRHLLGIATFILFLDPKDRDALRAVDVLRPLMPPSIAS